MEIKINGKRTINSKINIPPDKSISHRSIMIGSLASNKTIVNNFLASDDCIATLECFQKLGVNIERNGNTLIIYGRDYNFDFPDDLLDCKNSGTTARLISGILSTQKFSSILDGDSSLRKRPMKRVTNLLEKMGSNFDFLENDGYLPMKVIGGNLKGIEIELEIPSAQVKSSILFASLKANSKTKIIETIPSRNHTELMLQSFGANIEVEEEYNKKIITVSPSNKLEGMEINIPSDISSAAFFIVLALISEKSTVIVEDCILNPTRTGIIEVLKDMNANIEINNVRKINNELVGTIIAKSSNLKSTIVDKNKIPSLIDEVPILAVAASFADGTTIINGVNELRYKESDRVKTTCEMLNNFGTEVYDDDDRLIIYGNKSNLHPAIVNSYKDHRIAMASSIMASAIEGQSTILDAEYVSISFPDFYKILFESSKEK
ncbi:3-phosphoshikimate 1-carboxyvinyltransferase [Caldicellulosiruptoraceae bacterium PP1]